MSSSAKSWRTAVAFCFRRCRDSCRRPRWPSGWCATACRCVSSCNCTRSCGVANVRAEQNANVGAPAVVLLSGGLDSATVLAMARAQGYVCHCLSFDYGQRHRVELQAADNVAVALGAASHRTLKLDLGQLGGSALTDTSIAVPTQGVQPGIPVTYVPARNTVMLSLALAWAEILGAQDIFVGVNAVDYSGYPDCRPEYIAAFERMAN